MVAQRPHSKARSRHGGPAGRPRSTQHKLTWTGEQEVQTSPRNFRFATSCEAYRTLFDLPRTDAEKYIADFKSRANGEGRLLDHGFEGHAFTRY